MNRAVALAEESVALSRKIGLPRDLGISLSYLGWIYTILGETEKSERCFKEAFDLFQKAADSESLALSHGLLGLFFFERGEYSKAKEQCEESHEIYEKMFKLKYSGAFLFSQYLIWTYIELGEFEKAENLINGLRKTAVEVKDEDLIANVDALTAMLLRAQKRWKESVDYFEKSLEEHEALNARRWDVYYFAKMVLSEYGRLYLERGGEGDGEKAFNFLNQALEIFQKMGARRDIEKTMLLIEALHLSPKQTHEKVVSLESLEYTDVQSKIIATPKELKIGESLELEIEITNTGKKGAVLLAKITEVIPEGFAMVKKPELYRIEGNCLNMKEKRLDPSMKEEVKLVLTPKIQGTFHIKPKILYIDADGKEKTHEPKPASITVKELGIKGWLKGER
jgi:tetratricopeptide (TPR) repeat protein